MAGSKGKTAQKGKSGSKGFEISGDLRRIVPLNDGQHAYVFSSLGKTLHVEVSSAAYVDALNDLQESGVDVEAILRSLAEVARTEAERDRWLAAEAFWQSYLAQGASDAEVEAEAA